ncbi:hypothetical protein BGC07_11160 [Piscirickettsia litoralis]|uniref:Lipoprotein n=2 Tax=Piscirickettsia litoralis TaxID=1891921 RepID=A0ABX3A3D6_9GAMM|nr:hypothetical protein BGC07_11160 [Piscirickettsia litoralis]
MYSLVKLLYSILILTIIVLIASCATWQGEESVKLSFKKIPGLSFSEIDLAIPTNSQRIFMVKIASHRYSLYSCQSEKTYNYYPFDRRLCKSALIRVNFSDDDNGNKAVAKIYLYYRNVLKKIQSISGIKYDEVIEKNLNKLFFKTKIYKENIKVGYLPSDFSSHYVYSLIRGQEDKEAFTKKASEVKSVSFLQRNSLGDNQFVFINTHIINKLSASTQANLTCEYVWRNKVNYLRKAKSLCKHKVTELSQFLGQLMQLTPDQLREEVYRLRLHIYNIN